MQIQIKTLKELTLCYEQGLLRRVFVGMSKVGKHNGPYSAYDSIDMKSAIFNDFKEGRRLEVELSGHEILRLETLK